MTTQRLGHLLPASLSLLIALCPGCSKPAAQRDTEKLAQQVKDEAGCPDRLRQWYASVESMRHSGNSIFLSLPGSLTSAWWHGAKAYAVWGGDGTLQRISVTRDVYEPSIIIGRATASPEALGLKQQAGEPPAFYAQVTNGIYAISGMYK